MKKILIIGGGPAGLTSAYELSKNKEYEVTVLEESSVLGGISQTVRYNGNRMDIGGHRFFSKDETVMNWWRDMLPIQGEASYDDKILGRESKVEAGGPNPNETDEVMLVRHRVSRIYYKNHFFDYPVTMNFQTIKNMGFFTTIRAGFSYLWSAMFKKKETSLENFYINRFGKVLYGMFFEGYTEKLWGRHPREISADWGAQRVKGLSIRALLKDVFGKIFKKKNRKVETSLIEEFWYPKYGPGQLWELVGTRFQANGGKILFNNRVSKINMDGDKVCSLVCDTPNGQITYEADEVISSMPLNDFVASINNEVPENISKIAKGLPFRDFVTVGLLVDKLKLVNKTKIKTLGNVVPDCWIYVQDTNVKLGRIQIFNNWSPYMVKNPDETVWIGLEYFCNEGDDFWNKSQEDTVKQAISELTKIGVIDESTKVLDSHRERIKKAYPAYFDTYSEFSTLEDYLNGMKNVYFVGRNGQHRYNNMDHSMLTALNAVSVIENGGDKTAIWKVNTEKSYHESK